MERSAEEFIADARQKLLDLEGQMNQAFATARSVLSHVENKYREARKEALKSEIEFLTEKQLASRLQVSESTVARLRKKGKIQALSLGNRIRYSTNDLIKVDQLFRQASESRTLSKRR
jgi:excisionase family DNA binding protein